MRVEDRYGNGVPGVHVVFRVGGGRRSGGPRANDRPRRLGRCGRHGSALRPAGTAQTLTATAATPTEFAGASVSFSAVTVAPFFDVRIVHTPTSQIDEEAKSAFARAEARWEAAIGGNLSPVRATSDAMAACAPDVDHPPARLVDDLDIYVTVEEIDGPGSILAFAGPCYVRQSNGLPFAGIMVFDAADIDQLVEHRSFERTVLHEMGHVLGFGTVWQAKGLLRNRRTPRRRGSTPTSSANGPSRASTKPAARSTPGRRFPSSIWEAPHPHTHWRESVFGPELLTGIFDTGVPNPLSEVTIAALEDVGYLGISYEAADPTASGSRGSRFRFPSLRPDRRSAARAFSS